jgi:hypothetical protein
MAELERWRPIPGYESSYEVSDLGNVRSVGRRDALGRRRQGIALSPRRVTRDHLAVALYKSGVRRNAQVHVLVLEAFVGPRPDGLDGCHWNGDPTDNRLTNLRWDTRSANMADSVRHGTHSMASRTHCPRGHEYTPENTRIKTSGSRSCRACDGVYRDSHRAERRAQGRAYMRRRRVEQKAEAA